MSKFKVGDKVVLVDSVFDGDIRHGIAAEHLLLCKGRVGVVVEIEGHYLPFRVEFSHTRWWFPAEDLRLAEKPTNFPRLALRMSKAKSITEVRAMYKKAVGK